MPRSRPSRSRATKVSRRNVQRPAANSNASPTAAQRAAWAPRRRKALRSLVARTQETPWSANLLTVLIEELYVEDDFSVLLGDPKRLPRRRYPQAVLMALALRHSWRPDDLSCILRRLGIATKVDS
jgi:hypothetical protein